MRTRRIQWLSIPKRNSFRRVELITSQSFSASPSSFDSKSPTFLQLEERVASDFSLAELAPSSFAGQVGHLAELQNLVAEKLRAEIWVRPKVDLVATGSLPVTEGKAKRVIDKRSL